MISKHDIKDITFGELRCYLSRLDRLSMCILETMSYENFICPKDVPYTYDTFYVYGIGLTESEFYQINKYEYATSGNREKKLVLLHCIEIILSKEPKSVLVKQDKETYRAEDEENE